MSARYFYHAPDGRIYGPATLADLQQWRQQGRLRDDSKLKPAKSEAEEPAFLTFTEVLALPAAPEPVPPVLEVEEPEMPLSTPPPLEPPNSSLDLIQNGFDFYRQNFFVIWPIGLALQAVVAVFDFFYPLKIDAKTRMPIWDYGPHAYLAVVGVLIVLCFAGAVLTYVIQALNAGEEASLSLVGKAIGRAVRRFPVLLWTQFLGFCICGAWLILTLFLLTAATAAQSWVRFLTLSFAVVTALPTLLLFLRYLILPQVVLLEGKKGLQAIRRAIELVRFSSGSGFFSEGDLRLLVTLFLPWLIIAITMGLCAEIISFAHLPHKTTDLLLQVLDYVGGATATPLFIVLFVLFFLDARRRLRARSLE